MKRSQTFVSMTYSHNDLPQVCSWGKSKKFYNPTPASEKRLLRYMEQSQNWRVKRNLFGYYFYRKDKG